MKSAPLYTLMKPFVRFALRTYYRDFKADGLNEALPDNVPVIIISNHQNALIDPLLVCVESERQVPYLARASAFRNPIGAFFLKQLNMLPVYRMRDAVDIKTANDPIFNESLRRLCEGEIIGIFPEGDHGGRRNLRAVKKGFSRMARMALDHNCDPYICPVGIDYSTQYRINGSVQLIPGRGFYASEFADSEGQDFHNRMVVKAREVLEPVMLTIENELVDSLLWRLDRMVWNPAEMSQFSYRRELVSKLEKWSDDRLVELYEKVREMDKLLRSVGRTSSNFTKPRVHLLKLGFYRLGEGIIYPINRLIHSRVPRMIEDPQFTATMSFALYTLLVPSYVLFLSGVFALIGGWNSGLICFGVISVLLIIYRTGKERYWPVNSVSESQLQKLSELQRQIDELLL